MDQMEFICPRCRRAAAERNIQSPLKIGRIFSRDGDFILEGFLACSNHDCGYLYPILEGVPIILRSLEGWWCSEGAKLSCVNSAAPEMREYFSSLNSGGPSSHAERGLLSSYMGLHYGATCEVPVPLGEWADPRCFWETVVEIARPEAEAQYGRSLDLGCSVGRYTFELARFSALAVGLDLNFRLVSSAAEFHRTKRLCYERKEHGHWFEEVQASYSPPDNVLFLVADALDPPFSAESFDLVAGLNLIENVRIPLILIGQMDALLQSDGVLILGSPYEWRADICEPAEWLENGLLDAPEMVRRIIEGSLFPRTGLKYQILEEFQDVPWVMRHHSRYWSLFLVHIIKARKRKR